jgi:hypothetical protein
MSLRVLFESQVQNDSLSQRVAAYGKEDRDTYRGG